MGERKDNHELYAIKFVNKLTAELGRLDRELKLLKDVDHTNIVRLFSVYDLPDRIYFVMELCTGGHLGNLIARQSEKYLDEDWAMRLCRQLISAVAHIHSRGIAHRDIKLQNILMDNPNDSTSQVKLIDFGYGARFFNALPMRTKCGTPYTTAPEVLRENYDERCDVWSIGVVLYIMLSGRRPFETLDIPGPLQEAGKAAMITNILAGRYHFNHPAFKEVSAEGRKFVQLLLHPDYKTRIRSHEALENPWLMEKNLPQSALVKLSTTYESSRAISNMKLVAWNSARNIGMIPLVFGLQPTAANEMRQLFQSFDADNSGALSLEEYIQAMAILAPELTKEDVTALFHVIDIDNDGGISYTEFLAAALDPRGIDMNALNEAFNLMDTNGNGYITIDDIRKMVNVNTSGPTKKKKKAKRPPVDPKTGKKMPPSYYDDDSDDDSDDEDDAKKQLEQRIQEMIDFYDINHDGLISYDEFLWAMTGAGKVFGELPPTITQSRPATARPDGVTAIKTGECLLCLPPSLVTSVILASTRDMLNDSLLSPQVETPVDIVGNGSIAVSSLIEEEKVLNSRQESKTSFHDYPVSAAMSREHSNLSASAVASLTSAQRGPKLKSSMLTVTSGSGERTVRRIYSSQANSDHFVSRVERTRKWLKGRARPP